ncbi:MAG: RC-LH1 core complex protein PufX [Pseudomonadota bacterium]
MNDSLDQDVPTSTGTNTRADRMRADIMMQFLRGGFFAFTVFAGPILFIYLFVFIGSFLPPESKEAVDPTPDSFVSSSEDG